MPFKRDKKGRLTIDISAYEKQRKGTSRYTPPEKSAPTKKKRRRRWPRWMRYMGGYLKG